VKDQRRRVSSETLEAESGEKKMNALWVFLSLFYLVREANIYAKGPCCGNLNNSESYSWPDGMDLTLC
jgi:hypothetical protein